MKTKSGCAEIPAEHLERMASVLRLLAHPHRLRVIEWLERARAAPVHEITARLGLPQAAVSQHLNQMRRVGLIRAARRGKEVWYEIADDRALTILNCIRKRQEEKP
jgi:DNA-binding transcriptional ArsR family regulator